MPPILTDDFNAYNDGNLTGQGGWVGTTHPQVQGTVVREGAKAIKVTNGSDTPIRKIGTVRASGKQTVYMRAEQSNARIVTYFYNTSNVRCLWFRLNSSGDIDYYNGGGFVVLLSNYVVGHWYQIEVEWAAAGSLHRYRIDDGAWSGWDTGWNSWVTGLDEIGFENEDTGTGYWDTFQEDPIVAASPDETDKNNYNGYLAFIQQFIRHMINGTTPWQNPDGTLIP